MDLKNRCVIIVGSGSGKTTLARAVAEVHGHDLVAAGKSDRGLCPFVTSEVPTAEAFASLLAKATAHGWNICVIHIQRGGEDDFAPTIARWKKRSVLRDGVNLLCVVSPSIESDAMRGLCHELELTSFFQKQ